MTTTVLFRTLENKIFVQTALQKCVRFDNNNNNNYYRA